MSYITIRKPLILLLTLATLLTSSSFANIKVLTYNIAGRIPLHKGVPEATMRAYGICERLRQSEWDIVLIQEAWSKESREILKDCGFPYSVDLDYIPTIERSSKPVDLWHSSVGRLLRAFSIEVDSGIMILSRHPLSRKERVAYPKSGHLLSAYWDGEICAQKSGIIAQVRHPDGLVWIANTHLIACLGTAEYSQQRRHQLKDYVRWIKKVVNDEPVIFGGDFNFDITGRHSEVDGASLLNPLLRNFIIGGQSLDDLSTFSKDNPWNRGEDAGLLDMVFASTHFDNIAGGLHFTESDYQTVMLGKRPLSDHYAWGAVFNKVTPPTPNLD